MMSNMHETPEELFAFYALDTLSDAERSQVEAYVASNPDARARLDEMLRTASAMPFEVEPMEPSTELKQQVLGRVRADAAARSKAESTAPVSSGKQVKVSSGARWAYAFALASLLLAVALGIWGVGARNEIAQLKAQIATLQQEVESQRTVLVALSSPNAQTYAISGTTKQPQAQGHLITNGQAGSTVLVVSGLNPAEAGKTYEFWLIKDSTAVPAGLFQVNGQGLGIMQVTKEFKPGTYNAIAVSIEPNGGSPQPTGDIVMLGKIY
jgi:anti-sigma-K factor RskA